MSSEEPKPIVQVNETGLLGDIITSILTPGHTASGVIKLMFYTFYALFATLLFMIFLTGGNPHVIALLLLAVLLFVTIKWYISELEYIKRQEQKEKEKTT